MKFQTLILSASLLLSAASAALAAPPTLVEVEAGRGWEWEAIEDLFSLPQPARYGVGFSLEDGLVAAPLELVAGADAIMIGLPERGRVEGEIAAVLTASQTALVRVPGLKLQPTPVAMAERGAKVLLAGALGRVIGADEHGVVAWLGAPPPPLALGSPLLDEAGRVVGLHARTHALSLPWGVRAHLVTASSTQELVLRQVLRQLDPWLSDLPWLRGLLPTSPAPSNN